MKKTKWSQEVTKNSNALDLDKGVFSSKSPKAIAESLKKSADSSQHRKATPYQSAMSMLSFYINRGGSTLSDHRKKILASAKTELKRLYGR
jgi:hypothetical protein